MNCGNCGKGNEYGAKVCVHCGSTLALTEYFRATGFVEKKNAPKKAEKEPWDQDILISGRKDRKHYASPEEQEPQGRKTAPSTCTDSPRSKSQGQQKKTSAQRTDGNPKQTGQKAQGTKKQPAKRGKESEGLKPAREVPAERNRKSGTTGQKASSERKSVGTSPKNSSARQAVPGKTVKKIPKGKAYNHTTKSLSIAEKMVQKKTKKKRRKWVLPLVIALLLCLFAGGIFIGTLHKVSNEEMYTNLAADFVRALATNDGKRVSEYVHPKLFGDIETLDCGNVNKCDTKIVKYGELDAMPLGKELESSYGITDPVLRAYWVWVGYTASGEGVRSGIVEVVVADVNGAVYVVGTDKNPDVNTSPHENE